MLEPKFDDVQELSNRNEESSLKKIKITKEIRKKIDEFAEHLVKINLPYDALCWALAEFELIFEKGYKHYTEREVIDREKHIFDVFLDYEELCWFIANLKVYLEHINLYP